MNEKVNPKKSPVPHVKGEVELKSDCDASVVEALTAWKFTVVVPSSLQYP